VRPRDETERDAIVARLAESRAEIRRLLEPPPPGAPDDGHPTGSGAPGGFPRSRTMQMLMSGRGLGAVGALAGGLLIARPALAWRLLRLLPTSAVTRMIIARIIGSMRSAPK
jgi:hypothetical protein